MDTIKIKRLIAFLLSITIVFSITPSENRIYVSAAKPKLNKKSVTVYIGGSVKLKLKNNKKKVKWYSSNDEVAEVDSSGEVYAYKAGQAVITAKVKNKKYKCKVNVPVPSLSLDKYSITVEAGSMSYIAAICKKYEGYVYWESSNVSVATVSGGFVKALKSGTTVITAKIDDGQWAKCSVTVGGGSSNADYASTEKRVSESTTEDKLINTTTESVLTTTESVRNLPEVRFLDECSVNYDSDTDSQLVSFSLKLSDKATSVVTRGRVHVFISSYTKNTNENYQCVFDKDVYFTENDFISNSDVDQTSKICCIRIKNSDIKSGRQSSGRLSLSVEPVSGEIFSSVTLSVNNLPIDTTKDIKYIGDRFFEFNSDKGINRLFFALKLSDKETRVSASGKAHINIYSSNNEVIYSREILFTEKDFADWYYKYEGMRLLCCLELPDSEMFNDKAEYGYLSMAVELDSGLKFDPYDISIKNTTKIGEKANCDIVSVDSLDVSYESTYKCLSFNARGSDGGISTCSGKARITVTNIKKELVYNRELSFDSNGTVYLFLNDVDFTEGSLDYGYMDCEIRLNSGETFNYNKIELQKLPTYKNKARVFVKCLSKRTQGEFDILDYSDISYKIYKDTDGSDEMDINLKATYLENKYQLDSAPITFRYVIYSRGKVVKEGVVLSNNKLSKDEKSDYCRIRWIKVDDLEDYEIVLKPI